MKLLRERKRDISLCVLNARAIERDLERGSEM